MHCYAELSRGIVNVALQKVDRHCQLFQTYQPRAKTVHELVVLDAIEELVGRVGYGQEMIGCSGCGSRHDVFLMVVERFNILPA